MSASPDADVSGFYYSVDLSIDPPLPDSVAKTNSNEFLTLKQFKDETVDIVNGELTVVSKNITQVEAAYNNETYLSNYSNLKREAKSIAKASKDAGSKLNGQILVKNHDHGTYFRLSMRDNVVKVEAASLAWPDGTTSPLPEGGYA